MPVTSFLVLVLTVVALAAIPIFLIGVILCCFSIGRTKKKLGKAGLILMLAGGLLAVGNPVVWSTADGLYQRAVEGASGAQWVHFNAPGSGFVWNGVRYVTIEDVYTYRDDDGQMWMRAARPEDTDVLVVDRKEDRLRVDQPKEEGHTLLVELLKPSWVYPLENPAGLELYHHDNYFFCPKEQLAKASAYFERTEYGERTVYDE